MLPRDVVLAVLEGAGASSLAAYLVAEFAGGVNAGERLANGGRENGRWRANERRARRIVESLGGGKCAVCLDQPARFCGGCARSHFGAKVNEAKNPGAS